MIAAGVVQIDQSDATLLAAVLAFIGGILVAGFGPWLERKLKARDERQELQREIISRLGGFRKSLTSVANMRESALIEQSAAYQGFAKAVRAEGEGGSGRGHDAPGAKERSRQEAVILREDARSFGAVVNEATFRLADLEQRFHETLAMVPHAFEVTPELRGMLDGFATRTVEAPLLFNPLTGHTPLGTRGEINRVRAEAAMACIKAYREPIEAFMTALARQAPDASRPARPAAEAYASAWRRLLERRRGWEARATHALRRRGRS